MERERGEMRCGECGSCPFGGGVGRVCKGCCDRGGDGRGGMDLGGWLRRG